MPERAKYSAEPIDDCRWRIAKRGAMRTDGLIFANAAMMEAMRQDPCLDQVANVAHLPGIVGSAMAMPDIHWGYGFPIGGVAAFDADDGVISPGGVGYDINCGVRLLRTSLTRTQLNQDPALLGALLDALYAHVPSGVGSARRDLTLGPKALSQVMVQGAAWAVAQGMGEAADLDHCESRGTLPGADPQIPSKRAYERGRDQLGTLGSGNHFCEIGWVDAVFDAATAQSFGLAMDTLTIFIHTGSRGLGYQVCDDHLATMIKAASRYAITLPDRQLCCAPLGSPEGRAYLATMTAAANFAFANRQVITHQVRQACSDVLGPSVKVDLVYDVAHNIAKMERHLVDGASRRLCVHRKGATRALPPHHPELPPGYATTGQPVLVPGDMGRYSYVLAGCAAAATETFTSCCHGAGRLLSRSAALKAAKGRKITEELSARGVTVRAYSHKTLAEEMPAAYKDVAHVVDVVEAAGIARRVVRLRPLGVVKG